MASQITNYKCPACTGPLHYEGTSGKLECEYCGSSFGVAEIEELYAEKIEDAEAAAAAAQAEEPEEEYEMPDGSGSWASDAGSDWGEEAANMKAYNCPSCGAELICDINTAATSCPYCGNPTIIPGNFAGALKPDYIIPFKLDKMAAINALAKYYKGKKFLPKAFADTNHLDEITGVYVPFWLYDGEAFADMYFRATRVHTHTTRKERITITEHYRLRRAGSLKFEKIPVDASKKMPDTHMDAIEPYDYSELRPFSTAYMPGFLADKFDMSADECAERADQRAENSTVSVMNTTTGGFTTVLPESKNVRLKRGGVKYALLPVWMLSTRWKGQSFLFAMNGQTGKLIGDLPVDKSRYWAWFAGIAAPLAAVLAALLLF